MDPQQASYLGRRVQVVDRSNSTSDDVAPLVLVAVDEMDWEDDDQRLSPASIERLGRVYDAVGLTVNVWRVTKNTAKNH